MWTWLAEVHRLAARRPPGDNRAMRERQRRRRAAEFGLDRGAAAVARGQEHPVMRLQRSAGNAAVAKLMRNHGGGRTAAGNQEVPGFLNYYTPMMRELLAKVERGERLDRVELDTLREMRARARELALTSLVSECNDLIERASLAGIVRAPEEPAADELPPAASEKTRPRRREGPAFDPEAVAAAIGAATTAVIKAHVRQSRDHLDSLRGGRHHLRVAGVDYTLYDIDDVLLTTQDADAIEDVLRRVESARGEVLDVKAIWPTVVALCKQGVPVADILAMLEMYTVAPSQIELFTHWWAQATAALPSNRPRTAKVEDEPGPSTPAPTQALPPKGDKPPATLMNPLLEHFARSHGLPYDRPKYLLERLGRESPKLIAMRSDYEMLPGARFARAEFERFEEALRVLRGMRKTIQTWVAEKNWTALLLVEDAEVDEAIVAAHTAAQNVRKVAAAGEAASSEGLQAVGSAKQYAKETPEGPTPLAARKGGTDGVWDPGFGEDEMANWIDKSNKRVMNAKSVHDCVTYIQGHMTGGGSGGTGTHFGGMQVYHISHGKKTSKDGCTVFFTHAPDGTIQIVGVGSHSKTAKVAYSLDWRNPGWNGGDWSGNILTLQK
jgi:hypothetical protein